jgi:hypothetical protein
MFSLLALLLLGCEDLTVTTTTMTDGVLEVHGEAVIDHQGNECTADCGIITASCTAPLVEDPATVTLSYAGSEVALDAECTDGA